MLGLPKDKFLILSVSNNRPWKNLEIVARTMKKLGDNYLLVRIGNDIGTGISFRNVDSVTLNMIYNASDILLFPSLEEGFGFPLIEAMKTGLPAVVSDIEVFHEVADNAVEYINPLNIDSIVTGIKRAQDLKEKLISAGLLRAKIFSEETYKKELLSFYKKVTEDVT